MPSWSLSCSSLEVWEQVTRGEKQLFLTLPVTVLIESLTPVVYAAPESRQLQAGSAFTAVFAGGGMSQTDKVMWPKSQRKSAARLFFFFPFQPSSRSWAA